MTRKTEMADFIGPSVEIDISRQSESWPEDIEDSVQYAVLTALSMAGFSGDAEVSIVLADDPFVQELNKTYRGKDKPTNVLSFPQDEDAHLGDIVMAYETIAREAEEQNKDFDDHVTHMIVHGTLHLLGFDHEEDDEAEEMESLEIKVLAALGLQNPYESDDIA
jgi:probable rRNA maturation factor